MSGAKRVAWCVLILLALAGCGPLSEPEVFIPSPLPRTPTPTTTPSPTATPTDTPIPSPTPTPRPVQAVATTIFGIGDLTGLPPTALGAEQTPIQSAAGNTAVEYFVALTEEVAPGGNVTLFWSTLGVERAMIYRLDAEGARTQFWVVRPRGRLVVATRPTDREVARFALVIGEGESEIEARLNVPLSACSDAAWFFQPAPEGACPAGPAMYTRAAEQRFERGRMIWVEAEDRIYVVYDDGQLPRWQVFEDAFIEGETPESAPEFDNPPDGLIQPVRGFGSVWRGDEQLRSRLGWAVAPEAGYEGAVQIDMGEGGASVYLRALDGRVWALAAGGSGWQSLEALAPSSE